MGECSGFEQYEDPWSYDANSNILYYEEGITLKGILGGFVLP